MKLGYQRFGSVPVAVAVALLTLAQPVSSSEVTGNIRFPVEHIEDRLAGPITVLEIERARPKIEEDRSIRLVLAGDHGKPELKAKLKPVGRPAQGFNNEPRYELAAYALQKLFLEECEYVVPPIVLRATTLEEYQDLGMVGAATLHGTNSVLFLLSYWLEDVTNVGVWNAERFVYDPRYARHWGNLNTLTHLIQHKDANIGNLLISKHPEDPRVFAVDNDVSFGSERSDRSDKWKKMLVDRLPATTIERLKTVTRADLDQALGVLAEFRIEEGLLFPAVLGSNLNRHRGVRIKGNRVQFGLTHSEITKIMRRIDRLLAKVSKGQIAAEQETGENLGHACLLAKEFRN